MVKKRSPKELKTVGMTDEMGDDGSSPPKLASPTLGSAPTPEEADADVEKEKPSASPPPKILKPSVPLRVFAAVSGIKPDQFQAFTQYAQREEMRPCPITQWHDRFQAFQQKPVKRPVKG